MSRALPEIAPNLAPVVAALLDGLELHRSDLTPVSVSALERAAAELVQAEGLDLNVLRNARKLWIGMGETRPAYVRLIPPAYPEMARLHRKASERLLRAERERAERHALYEGHYQQQIDVRAPIGQSGCKARDARWEARDAFHTA